MRFALGPNVVVLHRHKLTNKYAIDGNTPYPADKMVENYNEYFKNHPVNLAPGERKHVTIHYQIGKPLRLERVGM
jgi:hypothetical protein